MNINELKSLLAHFNIRPDKRLGQNFLLSDEVLDEIVAAAELNEQDTVLEIGPGLGILTRRLVAAAGEVVAVEKDRALAAVLRKMFKRDKNVKIIQGDALFPETYLPVPQAGNLQLTTYKLVANIPYYITGKLLQNFLGGGTPPNPLFGKEGERGSSISRPSLMVLLLQKEVAQRITAKPGDMSILSVSVQFYSDPEIISFVGKDNFYPVPEVDSAIVRLRVLPQPRFDIDEGKFFQLVKIGFSNKRKQLHNNLTAGLPRRNSSHPPLWKRGGATPSLLQREGGGEFNYKSLLQSLGLNPLCRAQDLSMEDWKRLFDKMRESML